MPSWQYFLRWSVLYANTIPSGVMVVLCTSRWLHQLFLNAVILILGWSGFLSRNSWRRVQRLEIRLSALGVLDSYRAWYLSNVFLSFLKMICTATWNNAWQTYGLSIIFSWLPMNWRHIGQGQWISVNSTLPTCVARSWAQTEWTCS